MWILQRAHPAASCPCPRRAAAALEPGIRPVSSNPLHVDRRIDHDGGSCFDAIQAVCSKLRRTTHRQPRTWTSAAGTSCTTPAEGADTVSDSRAADLRAWVLEHSKSLPTQLTPVQRADGSYSLVTDEPVRRGQVLVRVPRRLLLSVETAGRSRWCGSTAGDMGLSEWQVLILHLLCERAAGRRSFWWPYLETLPQDMSFHPLLWGPERLAWLAGSPLVGQLRQRQAQVVEDCEALMIAGANDLPLAKELREASGADLVTHGSVAWAAAILLSRCFSLDLAEEEPLEGDMGYFGTWTPSPAPDVLALVPWADCLTHCSLAGPESCARYQYELGVVTLSAHREYRVGEAVADSHGPHLSPVDLFLDYGMEEQPPPPEQQEGPQEAAAGEAAAAPAGGSEGAAEARGFGWWQHHRFDVDPAEVAPPRSSRNAALLSALAAVQGEGVRVALGEGGPDDASLTFLRAALASDLELVKAGWRVKASVKDVEAACRAMGALSEPASAATEAAVLAALADYVGRTLAAFPTSLDQDVARLEGRQGCARASGPERLALVALASQKLALHGTAQAVAAWRAKLAAGCAVQELYKDEDEEAEWAEDEEDDEGEARGRGAGERLERAGRG